jgi:phosphoribosylamine-glycine ligase
MEPQPLDHAFDAEIIGDIEAAGWRVVYMPDSKALFGTGRSVKVEGTVDGVPFSTSFMPNGEGAHLLPIKADIRKAIGKDAGDTVRVHLTRRIS